MGGGYRFLIKGYNSGSLNFLTLFDSLPNSNSTIAINLRNGNRTGFRMYLGSQAGFSGVQPDAYEIWEYPNDGYHCCRRRFRIQSTYGINWTSIEPVYIDVNNQLWAYGFNNISDEQMKENIVDYKENALDKVLSIPIHKYNYKGLSQTKIGLIAQEVEKYFPEVVSESTISEENNGQWRYDKKIKGIDYSALVPILIKTIQELHHEIENLKSELKSVKEK